VVDDRARARVEAVEHVGGVQRRAVGDGTHCSLPPSPQSSMGGTLSPQRAEL
jgi:hypothetical protein